MNRLHINYTSALVLLYLGAMTLVMLASLYETCQMSAMDAVRVSADAIHGK
jgi:hypothetical protein